MIDAAVAARHENAHALEPRQALRIAWVSWLLLMAVPFVYFLAVVWQLMDDDSVPPDGSLGERWFIFSMVYIALAVPAAFFLHDRIFKAYWHGSGVTPMRYLKGMWSIWLTIEAGGIVALTGCLITRSLTPNLLPAMVAFMLFIPFWPSGRAMSRPCAKDDDDFEHYKEPR